MAYTPTNWQKGDVITAEKLNKMEQGIAQGGGVLMCVLDPNTLQLDHTAGEIIEAFEAGRQVLVSYTYTEDDSGSEEGTQE